MVDLWEFVSTYYIEPIIYDKGYNPIDTATYAIILVASLYGILKLVEKLKIKIDEKFVFAVSPYILLGSLLRVLEDAEVFSPPIKYLFISPFIYFLLFFFVLLALVFSIHLQKFSGKDYRFILAGIGFFGCFLCIPFFQAGFPNGLAGIAICIPTLVLLAGIYFFARFFNQEFLTRKLSLSLVGAHLLDGFATFIGVDFLGYFPKHLVESFLLQATGSASVMVPLKLAVVIPVIHLVWKVGENERYLLFLAILVLGLGPGMRNCLRIMMGV